MKEHEIRPSDLFDQLIAFAKEDIDTFFKDTTNFIPSPCPACGIESIIESFEKFTFQHVVCSGCGTLYVNPRPPIEQFLKFHAGAKSNEFFSSRFYKETAAARREKIHKPRAELIAQISKKFGLQEESHLVDIGSGFGIFLEEAHATNAFNKISGIEPKKELAEDSRRRGFNIIEKTMETVTFDDIQPTFMTCFEVFEHILNPAEFLNSIYRVLRPGGLLFFTTLTIDGFDLQVLWEKAKIICPPQHLNYFSIKGMRTLVEDRGFEIIEIETPGQLDVDIIRNIYLADPTLDLPRFVRSLIQADESTRQNFQNFLKTNRMSSHVRCIARKPIK